ncbi:MAG: amidohydrolase family protein [Firmicutes bacterium]|jgi:imidazolonepropionase-like amidohydrolase|nr:amidohydrolase family protein [Bacillota bacterium]
MILIRGGRVLTVARGTLEDADVLVDGNRIAAVGPHLDAPDDAEVIDARGKWVMPGLIDCHTHLGLDEEGNWDDTNELNEMGDPVTPHLRAVDGFCPQDAAVAQAVAAGVTAAVVTTGSIQVLSGQAAAVKLIPGASLDEALVRSPVGIKGGLGENPKKHYGKLGKYPTSRMGVAACLRQAFADAVSYRGGWRPEAARDGEWDPAAKAESLQPLLDNAVPWRVHAHRADDILTALRIASEFGIKVVIEHGTEAPLVARELAAAGAPVVLGPLGLTAPMKQESCFPTLGGLDRLREEGVLFSFTTDHPVLSLASLPAVAACAIRAGLPEEDALKAVTLDAARILGIPERLGSLEAGKDADIAIATGSPFDYRTVVETVLVNGTLVVRPSRPS